MNAYTSYTKLTEIKFITIGLASPERIRRWAEKTLPNGKVIGQVTNANTLHHKTFKPQKGGLFCERIFGPLKDFECACGKTQKPAAFERLVNRPFSAVSEDSKKELCLKEAGEKKENSGVTKRKYCPICDVEYTWSIIRRYQLGYIDLVSPVTHVWYLKATPSYLSIFLDIKKKHLEQIIYGAETMTLENSFRFFSFLDYSAHFRRANLGLSQDRSPFSTANLFPQKPTRFFLSVRSPLFSYHGDKAPNFFKKGQSAQQKGAALIKKKGSPSFLNLKRWGSRPPSSLFYPPQYNSYNKGGEGEQTDYGISEQHEAAKGGEFRWESKTEKKRLKWVSQLSVTCQIRRLKGKKPHITFFWGGLPLTNNLFFNTDYSSQTGLALHATHVFSFPKTSFLLVFPSYPPGEGGAKQGLRGRRPFFLRGGPKEVNKQKKLGAPVRGAPSPSGGGGELLLSARGPSQKLPHQKTLLFHQIKIQLHHLKKMFYSKWASSRSHHFFYRLGAFCCPQPLPRGRALHTRLLRGKYRDCGTSQSKKATNWKKARGTKKTFPPLSPRSRASGGGGLLFLFLFETRDRWVSSPPKLTIHVPWNKGRIRLIKIRRILIKIWRAPFAIAQKVLRKSSRQHAVLLQKAVLIRERWPFGGLLNTLEGRVSPTKRRLKLCSPIQIYILSSIERIAQKKAILLASQKAYKFLFKKAYTIASLKANRVARTCAIHALHVSSIKSKFAAFARAPLKSPRFKAKKTYLPSKMKLWSTEGLLKKVRSPLLRWLSFPHLHFPQSKREGGSRSNGYSYPLSFNLEQRSKVHNLLILLGGRPAKLLKKGAERRIFKAKLIKKSLVLKNVKRLSQQLKKIFKNHLRIYIVDLFSHYVSRRYKFKIPLRRGKKKSSLMKKRSPFFQSTFLERPFPPLLRPQQSNLKTRSKVQTLGLSFIKAALNSMLLSNTTIEIATQQTSEKYARKMIPSSLSCAIIEILVKSLTRLIIRICRYSFQEANFLRRIPCESPLLPARSAPLRSKPFLSYGVDGSTFYPPLIQKSDLPP